VGVNATRRLSLASPSLSTPPLPRLSLTVQDAPAGAEETITVPVDLTSPGNKPAGRLFITVKVAKPPKESRPRTVDEKKALVAKLPWAQRCEAVEVFVSRIEAADLANKDKEAGGMLSSKGGGGDVFVKVAFDALAEPAPAQPQTQTQSQPQGPGPGPGPGAGKAVRLFEAQTPTAAHAGSEAVFAFESTTTGSVRQAPGMVFRTTVGALLQVRLFNPLEAVVAQENPVLASV